MGMPLGKLYMSDELGAGQIATIEPSAINTNRAEAPIKFGTAVIRDGKDVKPATGGVIYGVALRRTYTEGNSLTEANVNNDQWQQGEVLGVVRDGSIGAVLSTDVKEGDSATVATDGTFKTATAGDTVVGEFLSDGKAGNTAELQIRIQFAQPAPAASQQSSK